MDDPVNAVPAAPRDYTALYLKLCDCAGPQPSTNHSRADEHRDDCPYRIEVERDGNSG